MNFNIYLIISNQYDSVTAAECRILAKVARIPDNTEEGPSSLRITEYITRPITGAGETVEQALEKSRKRIKLSV